MAHIENNDVRRAYARAGCWEERVKMLQWWADCLDELMRKDARVMSIAGRSKRAVHTSSRGSALNQTATAPQTPRRISDAAKRSGALKLPSGHVVAAVSNARSAVDATTAYCQVTLLRNEIESAGYNQVEGCHNHVAEALRHRFGEGPIEGRGRAASRWLGGGCRTSGCGRKA